MLCVIVCTEIVARTRTGPVANQAKYIYIFLNIFARNVYKWFYGFWFGYTALSPAMVCSKIHYRGLSNLGQDTYLRQLFIALISTRSHLKNMGLFPCKRVQ